ncbi:MAG: lysoplasmalogenase [Chitinophagaceae bacterium]
MKQNYSRVWLYLFWIALSAELLAILFDIPFARFLTKPLLMIGLAAWYLSQPLPDRKAGGSLITIALIFSWLGDVFLLFESRVPLFFIIGLSSFLLAHIFYIIYFNRLRQNSSIPFSWVWIIPVAVYLVLFMKLLQPGLGALTWPVRIYGLTICLMLFTAIQLIYGSHKKAAWMMLAGALLFVLSDSLLAINKFYQSFPLSGFCIMFTYGVAQLLIVTGAVAHYRVYTRQVL